MIDIPDDEDGAILIEGVHYKIGLQGFVFMWIDGEWMRSHKEPAYVLKHLKHLKQRG